MLKAEGSRYKPGACIQIWRDIPRVYSVPDQESNDLCTSSRAI